MTTLLPCPFCGGEAVMQSVNSYMRPAVSVFCLNCHSRTETFFTGYNPIAEKEITELEASQRATKAWNSRRG